MGTTSNGITSQSLMRRYFGMTSLGFPLQHHGGHHGHHGHHYTVYRKTIMVGNDYQAVIPEVIDRESVKDDPSKVLWDPTPKVPADVLEKYLMKCQEISTKQRNPSAILRTRPFTDDERALYTLYECDYDVDAALARFRNNDMEQETRSWTEEECKDFEEGIRLFGKRFNLIQRRYLPGRTTGELVHFYYLWKKTERFQLFAYTSDAANSDDDEIITGAHAPPTAMDEEI